MFDKFQSRETRYGTPSADQILVNRFFTIGYSYYFRQAKWVLEIVDPDKKDMDTVERRNKFRPDYRIPKRFRADLSDYSGSGYDRGHLVASANHNDEHIQNSETFLLSNMSPQTPNFNLQKWRELEAKIRELDNKKEILETYVITGPIFDFSASIIMIGENDDNGVKVPVPSHFYKCILTEDINGKLKMFSFEMPNTNPAKSLDNYLITTAYIEQRVGIDLWNNLIGPEIKEEKNKIRGIW